MSSIEKYHKNPAKVTGCVMTFLVSTCLLNSNRLLLITVNIGCVWFVFLKNFWNNFSTLGTTVVWVFLNYMEDINSMRIYNWADAIRNTLMSSIEKYHKNLAKVTGCV